MKQLIIIISALFLFTCHSCTNSGKGEPTNLDIYLLIGQSNMAGRAPITDVVCDTLEGVFLFRNDSTNIVWEKATNPLNRYSTIGKNIQVQKLGLGYSFAKNMAEPNSTIGLVVNARGGTSVKSWGPARTYYDEAVRRAKEAMKWGKLKGILWHQGETDAASRDSYLAYLQAMINSLRQDLGNDSIPVVIGEIYPKTTNEQQFNKLIHEVPKLIPHTRVVSADSTAAFDGVHFDTASQLLLGERYANAMRELQTTQ
ncbi:sialate O-acetylesterase [Bacteroides sp. 214]|uniref:sialate O-acetylesterase n=1 Tax=Bacteroides sp. 214 TaxID=2302935 RepID=UPI0013D794BE|nr:sialate O-acetylesterase [Bacteroides sp. 214]NDW12616.1 sialate O-acetylesterase [Bacteroides sp. 214]